MKFSDLKFSQNLHWQYDSGCGLQLYGDIPKTAKDHVEYVLKPVNCTLFTLKMPDSYNNPAMATWVGTLGYEQWVQFPPPAWREMQEANAAAMTHAVRVLPLIISELNDILNDDAKYPQLKLNEHTRNRIKGLLKTADTIKK